MIPADELKQGMTIYSCSSLNNPDFTKLEILKVERKKGRLVELRVRFHSRLGPSGEATNGVTEESLTHYAPAEWHRSMDAAIADSLKLAHEELATARTNLERFEAFARERRRRTCAWGVAG